MIKYAHSKENVDCKQWQSLDCHSENVARLAASFAEAFQSEEFARLLGWIHDLGKARESFQGYLMRQNGLDDSGYDGGDHTHSGAGACWSVFGGSLQGLFGRLLAYIVAGHHAGLPDWSGGETPSGTLDIRLETEKAVLLENDVQNWISDHLSEWTSYKFTKLPWQFQYKCPEGNFKNSDYSFWIRMLYSCLVDADFLDTESFMDNKSSRIRGGFPELKILASRFFKFLNEKQNSAPKTSVNLLRSQIREACEKAAEKEPGIFTLTVPTGGGKTLSSTAFALRHALRYGKERIIYVIPYTSIIEQTADVLSKFFGSENVLEHHSNFDSEKETERSRLASENWDAPIIVTTTVQFFESLYACKSSRCRKLHNIVNSVVILDEVQLLPSHLILPTMEAVRQLADHYGVSLLLSTATQPRFPDFDIGADCEIIPPELDLYTKLKRTEIEWPNNFKERCEWSNIAQMLTEFEQVLCVVNTRRDCRALFDLMPEGTIHLSAQMCGEHRSRVISEIKTRLAEGKTVRVISTQLVEAGVDFDFPVVYRAFTGLSSIAQAAGRCNREGRLSGFGKVVVFVPPKPSPCGELRKAEDTLKELLACREANSINTPSGYGEYFSSLYGRMNRLGENFRDYFCANVRNMEFQFREGATAFQMIDDRASCTIIVRYGENDGLIDKLLAVGPCRDIMRGLQRYTVSFPVETVRSLLKKGFVEEMYPGVFVQTLPSIYSKIFGFDAYRDGLQSDDLMI